MLKKRNGGNRGSLENIENHRFILLPPSLKTIEPFEKAIPFPKNHWSVWKISPRPLPLWPGRGQRRGPLHSMSPSVLSILDWFRAWQIWNSLFHFYIPSFGNWWGDTGTLVDISERIFVISSGALCLCFKYFVSPNASWIHIRPHQYFYYGFIRWSLLVFLTWLPIRSL